MAQIPQSPRLSICIASSIISSWVGCCSIVVRLWKTCSLAAGSSPGWAETGTGLRSHLRIEPHGLPGPPKQFRAINHHSPKTDGPAQSNKLPIRYSGRSAVSFSSFYRMGFSDEQRTATFLVADPPSCSRDEKARLQISTIIEIHQ